VLLKPPSTLVTVGSHPRAKIESGAIDQSRSIQWLLVVVTAPIAIHAMAHRNAEPTRIGSSHSVIPIEHQPIRIRTEMVIRSFIVEVGAYANADDNREQDDSSDSRHHVSAHLILRMEPPAISWWPKV